MIFQNLSAFYWLPLVAIPLLLNIYLINRQTSSVLPSLYFFNKLVKKKKLLIKKQPWILVILEMLFILFTLLMLAQPIIPSVDKQKDRLLLLVDDSPSMTYAYRDDAKNNQLYLWLDNLLKKNIYKKIEIKKLSELNDRTTIKINSTEKLNQYFKYLTTNGKNWKVKDLEYFFSILKENQEINLFDFVLYSDFKENHFNSPTDEDVFPSLIFLYPTETSPTITELDLVRKNYFEKELLRSEIKVELNQDTDLFLEIALNQQTIFYKKMLLNDSQSNQISIPIEIPLNINLDNTNLSALQTDKKSTLQNLDIFLKHKTEPFQHYQESIHVFPKKSIGVWGDETSYHFINSLFAYDLRKNHVTLSPVKNTSSSGFNTFVTLFPFTLNQLPTSLRIDSTKKYVFFISPSSSILNINQWFKKLGLNEFSFREKQFVKSSDRIAFERFVGKPHQSYQVTHTEVNEFIKEGIPLALDQYLTLYYEGKTSLINILSINDNPVIFQFNNILIISLFRPIDLNQSLHPSYLSWIYEGIFQLWRTPSPRVGLSNEPQTKTGTKTKIVVDLNEYTSSPLSELDGFLHNHEVLEKDLYEQQNQIYKLDLITILIIIQMLLLSIIVSIVYKKIFYKS